MGDIRVRIHTEDDLFDRYDADRETLNESFVTFLLKRYTDQRDARIRVISDVPIDEARFREALRRFQRRKLTENRMQRRGNRFSELYLFLLGVLCIVAGLLLKDFNAVYLQILSLTAGFAIKEAATIFFIKNPKNTLERARIQFLSMADIRFEQNTEGEREANRGQAD